MGFYILSLNILRRGFCLLNSFISTSFKHPKNISSEFPRDVARTNKICSWIKYTLWQDKIILGGNQKHLKKNRNNNCRILRSSPLLAATPDAIAKESERVTSFIYVSRILSRAMARLSGGTKPPERSPGETPTRAASLARNAAVPCGQCVRPGDRELSFKKKGR